MLPTKGGKPDWADLLRQLDRYSCPCGSGGPLAFDADCPGDNSDPVARDVLRVIVKYLQCEQEDSDDEGC